MNCDHYTRKVAWPVVFFNNSEGPRVLQSALFLLTPPRHTIGIQREGEFLRPPPRSQFPDIHRRREYFPRELPRGLLEFRSLGETRTYRRDLQFRRSAALFRAPLKRT